MYALVSDQVIYNFVYRFIVDVAVRNFKSWGQRDSVGTVVGNALLGRFDLAPITVLEYKNDDAEFRSNPNELITSDYKFNIDQAATNVKSVYETAYMTVMEKAMAAGIKDNRYILLELLTSVVQF